VRNLQIEITPANVPYSVSRRGYLPVGFNFWWGFEALVSSSATTISSDEPVSSAVIRH